jgi:hypothetical protein
VRIFTPVIGIYMYVPYLVLNDYLPTIQSGQLNNQLLDYLTQGGDFERKAAESWSIDKVKSILSSKFYLDFEFKPLLPFNYFTKYHAGDRCIIDFPDYIPSLPDSGESLTSSTQGYLLGDCVIQDGIGYCANKDNSDLVFTPANWTQIGNQYDIYFIPFIYPIFSISVEETIGISTVGLYDVDDRVCWINNAYSCVRATTFLSHQEQEQFTNIQDDAVNFFPNAKKQQQWKDLGELYFQGVLPFWENKNPRNNPQQLFSSGTSPIYFDSETGLIWQLGDNRNEVMKEIIVALSLYKLHHRIAPMNIPALREKAMVNSFESLRAIQKGIDTTSIPKIQPEQIGSSIAWGGSSKVTNFY